MAGQRKPGHKVIFVETPSDLAERFKLVAKHNRRSITGEALVAFERHLKLEEARILTEAEGEPVTAAPSSPRSSRRKARK
ncbi:MAG: hypothetical protein K2R98_17525 [Gemmataceae bacterium]|nr:hypothetical protein [Gemmataceae bacterium]